MERKPPPEDHDKDAENGDAKPSLDRFKSLTKGLLNVSREELAEEQRRHENGRGKKAL
jgi:hypothetical protein